MTITRADVADLRPGDVVEVRWPDTVILRGPLRADGEPGCLKCGPMTVRHGSGSPTITHQAAELTVISRAPRPLYVNHDRTEPVPGDVVRDDDGGTQVWVFADKEGADQSWVRPGRAPWWIGRAALPARLRLLVDGETGRVIP